jgi:hypothetical protein
MTRFRPSGLILPFFLGAFTEGAADPDSLRIFAYLARCAAAILLRAAALILRRLRGAGSGSPFN